MPAAPSLTPQPASFLVVDLDGTLVRCDLLHEAIVRLAARAPLRLSRLVWLHRGNLARFKTALAEDMPVDAPNLPYREEVLNLAREAARAGRGVVLATASPRAWAESIARHLGLFQVILATEDGVNLRGEHKLAAVRRLSGPAGFDYIGDARVDIPLFQVATTSWLAGGDASVAAALRRLGVPFTSIAQLAPSSRLPAYLRLCRPHHWAKNFVVLLPALTGAGLYTPDRIEDLLLVLAAMCCLASAVYIGNDVADIAEDRTHPEKKARPLAAAQVSLPGTCLTAVILTGVGLALGAAAGPLTVALLAGYLLGNAAYTLRLKQIPLIDVCLLTGFYLLRIMLGTVALGTDATPWFVGFLACMFTELALWKRYVEVIRTPTSAARRGYRPSDVPVLLAFGVGFSFGATIILALYVQSSGVSPFTIHRAGFCFSRPSCWCTIWVCGSTVPAVSPRAIRFCASSDRENRGQRRSSPQRSLWPRAAFDP